jgi:DNA-directed RNA polymerase specialized sigma24 family protein
MNENPHDEQLLLHCQAGDRQAFAEIASRYGRPLYGFLSAYLGGDELKKQQLLRAAFTEGFRNYQPGESGQSLLVLTLRALLAALAREKTLPAPRETAAPTLHIQWLLEAFAGLSAEEKNLILLRLQLDLLYEEMSFLLSSPESALKSKLKDARLHFRTLVAESMKGRYRELQQYPGKDS